MRFFKFFNRMENKILALIVLTTLVSSLGVFLVMYNAFYRLMVDDVSARTGNVNYYAQQWVTAESFTFLHTKEDETSTSYQQTQALLNRIRQLANVRYLFTAKRDATGTIIYVIDGLPPSSEDFRHIGDPVEAEILPELEMCLAGNKVGTGKIKNTDWGSILLTCWPKFDDKEHVVGTIVMEYDADALYDKNIRTMTYSVLIALGVAALCMGAASYVLRRVSESFYKNLAYTDALTGLHSRTAYEMDMDNFEKRVEEIVAGTVRLSIVVYDLNRLKVINDKFGHAVGDRYIRRMGEIINDLPFEGAKHYRVGGDEFISVVRSVSVNTIHETIERTFRKSRHTAIDESFFEFSYGIAVFDAEIDGSLQDTVNRADHAMYEFKREIKQGSG